MKKLLTVLALLIVVIGASAQDKKVTAELKSVVEEGTLLYRSEMATWSGMSLVLKKGLTKDQIGGFFARTINDTTVWICYSKDESPQVIGTVSFDSTFISRKAVVDLTTRSFTKTERELYLMYAQAIALARSDTLFRSYEKTIFRAFPIMYKGVRKVYILTESTRNNEVIFGNDYVITFSDGLGLVSAKRVHKSMIAIEFGKEEEKPGQSATSMHTHNEATGDMVTPTDICVLLLFERSAKWKQHTILTPNYVYVWNCQTHKLSVATRNDVKKAYEAKQKNVGKTSKPSTQSNKTGTQPKNNSKSTVRTQTSTINKTTGTVSKSTKPTK